MPRASSCALASCNQSQRIDTDVETIDLVEHVEMHQLSGIHWTGTVGLRQSRAHGQPCVPDKTRANMCAWLNRDVGVFRDNIDDVREAQMGLYFPTTRHVFDLDI